MMNLLERAASATLIALVVGTAISYLTIQVLRTL